MKSIMDATRKPYYDSSAEEISKGYVKLLSVPGRTLQNRELNVMTGLAMEHIKNIGDNILTNGTVVSGCSFFLREDIGRASLSNGKIYVDGYIIDIPNAEWPIEDVIEGVKFICVEILQMAITEEDDPLLKDPAEKYENYGEPGAHRLKIISVPLIFTEEELKIAQSGSRRIIDILKLINGRLIGPTKPKPAFGKMYDYLAHRTFDEVGNFIAKGMKVSCSSDESTIERYKINISPGRAYVMGYEYSYDNQNIKNKSAIDSKNSTVDEVRTFTSSVKEYKLFKPNVKLIEKIQCQVRNNNFQVIRSVSGSMSDILKLDSVKEIHQIFQGNNVYVNGRDWTRDGNSIVWLSSNRPASGSTFFVDISYIRRYYEGVDYSLSVDDDNYTIIMFQVDPEENSDFTITYTWYLSRYDLVYIDISGELKVISGIAGEEWEITVPQIPINTLPLAYIYVKPGKQPSNYTIQMFNIYRVSVVDQRANIDRLNNLEFNLAMTALETEAQKIHEQKDESQSSGNLKGIYVDSFADFSRSDYYHPDYRAGINIFEQELRLPLVSEILGVKEVENNKIIDTSSTTFNNDYMISLPYSELAIDWQRYATDSIDLNPYNLIPLKPILEVKPPYSVKIEERIARDTEVILPLKTFMSSSTIRNSTSRTVSTSTTVGSGNTVISSWNSSVSTSSTTSTSTSRSVKNETFKNISMKFLEDLDTGLMPQETLRIKGRNFIPFSEVRLNFDDVLITSFNLLPNMGTVGSLPYQIKTNSRGEFELDFKTPVATSTGTKLIMVSEYKQINNEWQSTDTVAITSYTGLSFIREMERITEVQNIQRIHDTMYINTLNTTTVSVVNQLGWSWRGDPLAQSFWFDEDTFISSFDLFFESKPDNPEIKEIWYMIREISGGEPNGPILYRSTLRWEDIKTSPDATIPTNFKFNFPIYCQPSKEYALIVGCDRPGYKIYFAKMSNKDIMTNTLLQSQTHKGTMFTSSNNVSWTTHQDQDLTFTLYRAKFNPIGTLLFKPLSLSLGKFSLMNISFDSIVLEETEIKTTYQINNKEWYICPLSESISIESNYDDRQDIIFKFELSTSDDRKTPFINLNTLSMLFAKYGLTGSYIMRSMEIPN